MAAMAGGRIIISRRSACRRTGRLADTETSPERDQTETRQQEIEPKESVPMRQTISAIAAAIVVTAASALPAMACGGGGCHYVSPCAQDYVAVPEYSPYYSCTGWGFERMPDPLRHSYPGPVHQYYYVDQGPTYDGPGEFAPYRTYRQSALGYHHPVVYSYREHHWRPSGYYYGHHHVHHMHVLHSRY